MFRPVVAVKQELTRTHEKFAARMPPGLPLCRNTAQWTGMSAASAWMVLLNQASGKPPHPHNHRQKSTSVVSEVNAGIRYRFEYVTAAFFLAGAGAGAGAGFFSGMVSSMMIFLTPWSVVTICGEEELICPDGRCRDGCCRDGCVAGAAKLTTGNLCVVSQVAADC